MTPPLDVIALTQRMYLALERLNRGDVTGKDRLYRFIAAVFAYQQPRLFAPGDDFRP